MKYFITGYKGYIGSELVRRGFIPLECDIRKYEDVERAIQKSKPDLLIHLAGKSDVDFCEQKHNQEEVIKTNVRGTYFVFENLKRLNLPGVLLSSDQVWKGGFFESHSEYSKRTPPVNFYGMSKVAAESIAINFGMKIVRTSYLFDYNRLSDRISDLKFGLSKDYPVFIRRSFLHLQDFCDLLENYCGRFHKMPEVLHLSGSQSVSWYKFMKDLKSARGLTGLVKARFFEKRQFAPRPWFGGLNIAKSIGLGFPIKSYLDGIDRMKE